MHFEHRKVLELRGNAIENRQIHCHPWDRLNRLQHLFFSRLNSPSQLMGGATSQIFCKQMCTRCSAVEASASLAQRLATCFNAMVNMMRSSVFQF